MNEENATKRELPKYKCHKVVHALKIKSTTALVMPGGEGATIVPEEEEFAAFHVDQAFVEKHIPGPGGYYVVYEDGYKSFSPGAAFEAGYTRLD